MLFNCQLLIELITACGNQCNFQFSVNRNSMVVILFSETGYDCVIFASFAVLVIGVINGGIGSGTQEANHSSFGVFPFVQTKLLSRM